MAKANEQVLSDEAQESGSRTKGWWKPVLLLALVVGVLVLASTFNIGERIAQLRGWIDSLGNLGLLVYTLIYIIAVVAAIPGSPITVLAGALFGSVLGVIVVSIGSTIGAGLAFLVGRYFARDAVARWLKDKEKFKKLDRLTEEHGSIIVAITRLVPVFPFNVLNYGYGLTRVKFWTYVFWSWLCMLPGTILYVVGADAVTKGLAQGRVPWALIGVAASVIIILTLLVRQARKQLQKKEQAIESNA